MGKWTRPTPRSPLLTSGQVTGSCQLTDQHDYDTTKGAVEMANTKQGNSGDKDTLKRDLSQGP